MQNKKSLWIIIAIIIILIVGFGAYYLGKSSNVSGSQLTGSAIGSVSNTTKLTTAPVLIAFKNFSEVSKISNSGGNPGNAYKINYLANNKCEVVSQLTGEVLLSGNSKSDSWGGYVGCEVCSLGEGCVTWPGSYYKGLDITTISSSSVINSKSQVLVKVIPTKQP